MTKQYIGAPYSKPAPMQYTMPLSSLLKNCQEQTLESLKQATHMDDVEMLMQNYYAVCDLCKSPNTAHAKACAAQHNLVSFLTKEAYEEITTGDEEFVLVFTRGKEQVFTLNSTEFAY